jgi:ribonuclease VapC
MEKQVYVLDTSALLALIGREQGADIVAEHLARAVMSSVNLAEVVTVLVRREHPKERIGQMLHRVSPQISEFEAEQAVETGYLYHYTKAFGLSLGDRACLVLAQSRNLPVLTADKIWQKLDIGVDVRMIR